MRASVLPWQAACACCVMVILIPCAAAAQGDPVGPEFRVNTHTTSNQRYPSVAVGGSTGDFVVVWVSSTQDGSGFGVFGQRHASAGVPVGPEFRVNTYTTDAQAFPAIASDPSANFVVLWQSRQDGSDYGIFGQRYASSGAPLGPEFRVNTYTTNLQTHPSVAADSAGNFVVVWQGGSPFAYNVFGQRYASSGTPLGPEFRVNTSAFGSQDKPSIGSDSSGNFVVVWEENGGQRITGQRYASSGAPLGPEFNVALACLPCSARTPAVASDSAGTFVVVWVSNYPYGGSNNWIFGRRFASSGAPLGTAFRVNTYQTNYQTDPAVAADASGNFVVVWASADQDGSLGGVFGQRFLGSGLPPLGPEFRVNTYTTQAQKEPAVAVDAAGNFVVTWNSYVQDGSGYGIFGQRYNMIVPVELMHFGVE
jgi:hypothetical protein